MLMKYDCVGIGVIKMTVGVKRRTHEKVQYCITAMRIEKDAILNGIPMICLENAQRMFPLLVGLGARISVKLICNYPIDIILHAKESF